MITYELVQAWQKDEVEESTTQSWTRGISFVGFQQRRSTRRSVGSWSAQYYDEKQRRQTTHQWIAKLRPSVVGTVLALCGRCVVAPLLLLVVCITTGYGSSATFFIGAKDNYFAYSELDPVLRGGCTGCICSCRKVLMQLSSFDTNAIMSKPVYEALQATASEATGANNFSSLPLEVLKLADYLDARGTVCSTGVNDWGTPNIVLSDDAQNALDVINTLGLSVSPSVKRELEVAVEEGGICSKKWSISALLKPFLFQMTDNSLYYTTMSIASLQAFPRYPDCRPDVSLENLVGEKLALGANGDDLIAVVPEILKLFPYEFTSNLKSLSSRYVKTKPTINRLTTVTQLLHQGFYGGCRCAPQETFASTIYITQNEYTNDVGLAQAISAFRSRYADTVALSMLPAMVVAQMLFMGIVSLYQVMSHHRSVLLAQIWAYRCQNGRMQLLYLAQVTYHLAFNSNLYYLGLSTGTLSSASVTNFVLCTFAFTYSFVNLAKARTGEQLLDREFRLLWEIILLVTTVGAAALLSSLRLTSLSFIGTYNGELLRRTSELGAKYCGLKDSCYVFTINLVYVVASAAATLGLITEVFALGFKLCRSGRSHCRSGSCKLWFGAKVAVIGRTLKILEPKQQLTSFEVNCIGAPFPKLFKDCDDFAYVMYMNKRCTTVEALLLSGYLFYGKYVYRAESVALLVVGRLLPRSILRTFNLIILRWPIDTLEGTLSAPLSCLWVFASTDSFSISDAMPLA
ncbi:unnamed protein product [Phytophthora fragariaefolia]|uniref:Unnamed protein product n=1 Tax=Phytophthora fragariaefolia TaxID=1490495 RepID=A0A9W6UDY0_9STRA|nr:unnamed protein product [Phytophthora fragariaefolia]